MEQLFETFQAQRGGLNIVFFLMGSLVGCVFLLHFSACMLVAVC